MAWSAACSAVLSTTLCSLSALCSLGSHTAADGSCWWVESRDGSACCTVWAAKADVRWLLPIPSWELCLHSCPPYSSGPVTRVCLAPGKRPRFELWVVVYATQHEESIPFEESWKMSKSNMYQIDGDCLIAVYDQPRLHTSIVCVHVFVYIL